MSMTYDQWKCTDPREFEPEPEECPCEDYDTDWEGFATCASCGRMWSLTAEQIKADAECAAAYDAYIKREEWKEWLLTPLHKVQSWLPRRKREMDDEIPF